VRPPTVRQPERGAGHPPAPRFFVLVVSLASLACTVQERPITDDETDASTPALQGVEAMLNASAASWNAGDLAGFLDDYSDDPVLAFVGAAGVTRGIAEVRARYETGYWSTGAPMDSLRFEDLEVRPLGERHALALGRYVLYRPVENAPDEGGAVTETISSTGWFSLVLGLEEGSWRILHDHTSELDAG
jgi:ketosteroid isomerase-like protein